MYSNHVQLSLGVWVVLFSYFLFFQSKILPFSVETINEKSFYRKFVILYSHAKPIQSLLIRRKQPA